MNSPTIPEVYHCLLRRRGRARSASAWLVLCAAVARPLDSTDLVAVDQRSALVIMLESDAADLPTQVWPVMPAQAADGLAGPMRLAERIARRSRSHGTPAQETLAEILLWLPFPWRFPILKVLTARRTLSGRARQCDSSGADRRDRVLSRKSSAPVLIARDCNGAISDAVLPGFNLRALDQALRPPLEPKDALLCNDGATPGTGTSLSGGTPDG